MDSRGAQHTPASVLPDAEVRQVLIDHLLIGMAGLWGRLSSLVGDQRQMEVLRSAEAVRTLEDAVDEVLAADRPGVPAGTEGRLTLGIVGTGSGGGHPVAVQVIWHPEHVDVVAHALRGPGMQGSPTQALAVVEEALAPHHRR
ncbi:hypothetical protein [Nesterenkonia halobia]|uniref:Uncharacterized protein n=1 Tax=Nesterenkonia halobia TaxID=37922 RepID=A0ABP6RGF1_9MICC